jgi:hypothetical protein
MIRLNRYLIVFLSLCILLCSCGNRGIPKSLKAYYADRKNDFFRNQLCIIATNKPEYDSLLKKSVAKYWDSGNNAIFVTPEEAKVRKRKDTTFSFIESGTFIGSSVSPANLKTTYVFSYLSIKFGIGGPRKYKYFDDNIVYEENFNYSFFETTIDSGAYRLPMIVWRAFDKLSERYKNVVASNPIGILKKKTLAVPIHFFEKIPVHGTRKRMFILDKTMFKDYPYKIELVTKEKMAKLIAEQNKDYLFGLPHDGYGTFNIHDLEDFKLVCKIDSKWVHELPINSSHVAKMLSHLQE